jgi:hypothetical protein
VELGAVKSLLGLLAHDNTDVSLAVVGLLSELTDSDTAAEASESMGSLVDCIVAHQASNGLRQTPCIRLLTSMQGEGAPCSV